MRNCAVTCMSSGSAWPNFTSQEGKEQTKIILFQYSIYTYLTREKSANYVYLQRNCNLFQTLVRITCIFACDRLIMKLWLCNTQYFYIVGTDVLLSDTQNALLCFHYKTITRMHHNVMLHLHCLSCSVPYLIHNIYIACLVQYHIWYITFTLPVLFSTISDT